MMHTRISIAVVILATAAPAFGQASRYENVPLDPGYEHLLFDRLKDVKDRPFFDLLDRFIKNGDPSAINIDAIKEQLDGNPNLRERLKEFLAKSQKNGPTLGPTEAKEFLDSFLKTAGKQPAEVKPLQAPSQPATRNAPTDNARADIAGADTGRVEHPKPIPDRLNRWLQSLGRRLEESNLPEWLRDSPAFRQGLNDMEMLKNFNKDPAAWGLGDLPERLRLPDSFKINWGILDGLKGFDPPELPRLNLPPMNLGGLDFGGWSLPTAPLPHFGGGDAAGFGRVLLWLLVIVTIGIVIWQVSRRLGPVQRLAFGGGALGPWPVDPKTITTRRQLVQAFDYLAVRLLGVQARPWNHRAIAKKFGNLAQRGQASEELAHLYELARYTNGPEQLSSAEQQEASRCISLLARVPAS